jgi:hypothetical protein
MSNDWEKSKSDFNDLVKLWDDALKQGIFEDSKTVGKDSADFFGNTHVEENPNIGSGDYDNWNDIISRSGELFPDENMVLMEAARKKDKKIPEQPVKGFGNLSGDKPFTGEKSKVKTTMGKEGKGASVKKNVEAKLKSPNPIVVSSVGSDTTDKDGKVRVTAGLAADEKLSSLEKLKLKLYDLECKMNTKDGLDDKKAKSMEKQFSKLLQKIEKISNEFGGTYKNSQYHS